MKHAIIIGSGVNGLCAGITLARAGVRVTVLEAADAPGGCIRTEALTLPGFLHDAGAAVFPMTVSSPLMRTLPLQEHGLQWIEPEVPVAHPLEDGEAVALLHNMDATAELLGRDGAMWTSLMRPMVQAWPSLAQDILSPLTRMPSHPFIMARLALNLLQPATRLAARFQTTGARGLFAGVAAHGNMPLSFTATSGPGLVLAAAAHTVGWPIPQGGAQAVTSALVSLLKDLGGEVLLSHPVKALSELPTADAVLLDVSPTQFLQLAGEAVPQRSRHTYTRFRHSPGVCKVDWALSAPIPWSAELCRRAGTVHVGGSFEEIAASEQAAWDGRMSERPYVLLSQPSIFDPTRAPVGKHTAWAYCHVPAGSDEDATARIEDQVEHFAPGFRATILARHTRTAQAMEMWNANLIGGDISGGAMTLAQMLRRPTLPPYRTPLAGVFLCSSSTPPGGGVHGMCGYHAAHAAATHMKVKLQKLT
jgi:phytoene dehydrogenase-like protein